MAGYPTMITRRKAITVGGATVLAPSFATVVTAETDSGNVEITTTTTQPAGTNVEIRAYEDTDMDSTSESQQLEDINSGTDIVTEYAVLNGKEGQGNQYWFDVILSTTDDAVTPEVDSMTITLPGQEPEPPEEEPTPVDSDPQNLEGIIDNYLFFVAAVITAVAGIGVMSKSLAIGAVAAYTTFALIAIQTGTQLFQNILVVTLVLVFVGFAFKFWRLEGMGE